MTGRKKTETLIHLDMEKLAKDVPSTKDVIRKDIKEADPESPKEETVGTLLKKARTSKNKTLEDVSKKICVKTLYLDALETGKFYAFPNMTYGIGFLRLYAGYLGLDAKELIDKFKVEANLVSPPTQALAIDTEGRLPSKKLALISLTLGVCLIGGMGIFHFLKARQDSIAPSVLEETVATPTEVLSAPNKEPLVYGQPTAGRLSLTATEEVWIEVADAKGTVLLNQILYAGDKYNPPDDGKYHLSTGNAGALTLTLDGADLGTLGPLGEQKKGILLDPDVLKIPEETTKEK